MFEADMAAVVRSREASISTLRLSISEYEAKAKEVGLETEAGFALMGLVKIKRQRLVKLEKEVKSLRALISSSNQTSIPGTEAPKDPVPAPVMGRGRPPGKP